MTQLPSSLPQDPAAILVRDVTKIFHPPAPSFWRGLLRFSPAKPVTALSGVSLTIDRGEIFGLVGRNGQGKTTLIKCLASLLQPTRGTVSILGHDTMTQGEAVHGLIGLVSADERTFYGRLSGWQNLLFFARLYGLREAGARRRIQELAGQFDFLPLLKRRFQELSSGNKQRMALIRALLIDPPVVLLDEPTRSLDPIAADDLRRVIQELSRARGKTILITSHNLQEVETLCTRVGFLSRGEIKLCASMDELARRYFDLEQVTLRVAGITELNGLAGFESPLQPVDWTLGHAGLATVRFRRRAGDDTLDRMIRAILAQGGRVLDCRSERDGLREIMDTIEAKDRNPGDEAVAERN